MSKNSEIILTDSAVDFLKEEIGGGEGIEYVEIDYHSTTITQEQATALQNGSLIKAISGTKFFIMIPSSLRGEYCTGADRAREGKVYVRHCKIDFTNLTVTWDDFELQLEGGGDPITLGTTFAVSKQIQGKHLDVDALLTLVNKYAPEGTQRMFIGLYSCEPNNFRGLIEILADGCSSGIYVAQSTLIFTTTYENDVAEFLTNNKVAIEEATIDIQSYPDYAFLGINVLGGLSENELDNYNTATSEEILSLFVD